MRRTSAAATVPRRPEECPRVVLARLALVEQKLAAERALRRLDHRAPGLRDTPLTYSIASRCERFARARRLRALELAVTAQDLAMLGLVRLEERLLDLSVLPLLRDKE